MGREKYVKYQEEVGGEQSRISLLGYALKEWSDIPSRISIKYNQPSEKH